MINFPSQGRRLLLGALLGQAAIPGLALHLYTNNKTPADSDTEADYEEAPPGYGYAPVPLSPGDWSLGDGEATYPELTISFLGALGNVYGYYVTHTGNGRLLWAERFADGPYNIANNGDQIMVAPHFTLTGRRSNG